MICNISYGTEPNFENLPNNIISGPDGVSLTQLVSGEENFYVVSADIGSLTVKVKGSLRTGAVSLEIVRLVQHLCLNIICVYTYLTLHG